MWGIKESLLEGKHGTGPSAFIDDSGEDDTITPWLFLDGGPRANDEAEAGVQNSCCRYPADEAVDMVIFGSLAVSSPLKGPVWNTQVVGQFEGAEKMECENAKTACKEGASRCKRGRSPAINAATLDESVANSLVASNDHDGSLLAELGECLDPPDERTCPIRSVGESSIGSHKMGALHYRRFHESTSGRGDGDSNGHLEEPTADDGGEIDPSVVAKAFEVVREGLLEAAGLQAEDTEDSGEVDNVVDGADKLPR
ncbi:hypothetical protein V500_06313 [Pseudogymnoascus sp. VKM F-4518 (FW-2643)]|nr:hypothetical protein V500_06313 [Pseudogymnoascus sp. VKM F-4518 (FW-2643)]